MVFCSHTTGDSVVAGHSAPRSQSGMSSWCSVLSHAVVSVGGTEACSVVDSSGIFVSFSVSQLGVHDEFSS